MPRVLGRFYLIGPWRGSGSGGRVGGQRASVCPRQGGLLAGGTFWVSISALELSLQVFSEKNARVSFSHIPQSPPSFLSFLFDRCGASIFGFVIVD